MTLLKILLFNEVYKCYFYSINRLKVVFVRRHRTKFSILARTETPSLICFKTFSINIMKRNLTLIFFICSLILINSCDTTKQFTAYEYKKDQFAPNKMHLYSSTIAIKGTKLLSPEWACFTIDFIGEKGNSLNYIRNRWSIETTYAYYDWAFVDELKFVVDDKVLSYRSSYNPLREVSSAFSTVRISEINVFQIDEELLQSIKSAKKVAVRLSGQHSSIDKDLTPTDIYNIGWFYDYIKSRTKD